MKRTLALLLSIVMMLSLLAACGGDKGGTGDDPGEEQTEGTPEPGDDTSGGDDASEDDVSGEVTLTLNMIEVTLNAEGATFQLKASTEPAIDGIIMFASDDTSVAAVSDDGTITAISPGTAVITASCDGLEAARCTVTCDWEKETPAPEETPATPETPPQNTPVPDTPAPNEPEPAGPPASSGVDLAAFYDAVLSGYDMAAMEDISGMSDILDNFYAGLSGINTRQSLVCVAMMTGVVCEIVLIEVADAADVEAVKDILQARIDYQIEAGAYYPAAVEGWTNNSRIVSNGNYIMMIAHQDCDSIAAGFNALF